MAITIPQALETFVRGFCFTRSFTHPFIPEKVGALWVMRDGPRKRGNYRTEEWVSFGVAPEEVDALVRAEERGRFVICAICPIAEPIEPLRDAFKALNYRLVATEPLMVHDLNAIPAPNAPANTARVMTEDVAKRLNKAARKRQILPDQLVDDAPIRQYAAWLEGELVGWVRSIVVGETTWCSDMFVKADHRRQGIGSALLAHMLRDDKIYGTQHAVLLASHTGAKLYTAIGYEQIGTLLLLSPKA